MSLDIQIPANIFQTWHTKMLPPKMFTSIAKIKQLNPGFKYYLFDDNDCRDFIQNNFEYNVLNAYDRLIPGAYKADLWRYCVLYKHGGIYLDIKYIPNNNFKFINFLKKEHWVLDVNNVGIYNAFMVCKPGNEILLKAINQIVENVDQKFYGSSWLEPTGPRLLSKYFTDKEKQKIDITHILIGSGSADSQKYIMFKNILVLKCYTGYHAEREKYSIKEHYAKLWERRQIYL
jgi:mannosyltransferase OCH1-like enzyme